MDLTLHEGRLDRERVLADLLREVDGDFAAIFDVRVADGEAWFGEVAALGLSGAVQGWSRDTGRKFDALWSPFDPGAEMNRLATGITSDTPFTDRYYAPYGLRWQRRLLIYDGSTFVAWLGVVRTADARDFDAREIARLRQRMRPIAAALRAEARLRDGMRSDRGATLIVRADGTIEHASEGASLDRAERARLGAYTRRIDAGAPLDTVLLEGFIGRWVRLVGSGEACRYCWTLAPTAPPSARLRHGLSPKQQRVAELASRGLATRQIAAELGISTETAKQHLDSVYARLGIASRIELRAQVAERERTW